MGIKNKGKDLSWIKEFYKDSGLSDNEITNMIKTLEETKIKIKRVENKDIQRENK